MPIPWNLFGWHDLPNEVEACLARLPMPYLSGNDFDIRGSGEGKVVLLHRFVEQIIGEFPIHKQAIGDCVSHGWGLCTDVLACVDIAVRKEAEEWKAEAATEAIYGGSRVEIGGGRLGNSDGSTGAWAAEFVSKYGILARLAYGSVDLTSYSGQRAKDWGRRGVPDDLEPVAREHPVKTTSLVTTYEEARDAIANGYPVAVCSMQGFSDRRDGEGFARPQGSWAHCMSFIAVDDQHSRPGLLCMNSWGPSWISGPKRHDQPEGSFWVDAVTCTSMLRGRDSFALSGFVGYPRRELDYILV